MSFKNFNFFINYIFPLIILVFGLIGNILGFLVILRKRLKSIGPTHIYCYLFASDTAYLVQIVITYLYYAYDVHISVNSSFSCKLWVYLNYALGKVKFKIFDIWIILGLKLLNIKKMPSRQVFSSPSQSRDFCS